MSAKGFLGRFLLGTIFWQSTSKDTMQHIHKCLSCFVFRTDEMHKLNLYHIFLSKCNLSCFSVTVKKESSASVVPAKPVLSEEETERKSKSIIDEFLHINDYKVVFCFVFILLLCSESAIDVFIYFFIV